MDFVKATRQILYQRFGLRKGQSWLAVIFPLVFPPFAR
jgi:hypothetical protein